MVDAALARVMFVEGGLSLVEIADEFGVGVAEIELAVWPPDDPAWTNRWRPYTPWPSKCNARAIEPHKYRLDDA